MKRTENTSTNPCSVFKKTIGQTTYVVDVHFSKTSKETLTDKIKRMLLEEVRWM